MRGAKETSACAIRDKAGTAVPPFPGVDLITVKELMGHADISVTMRYAHPTPETKRAAVDGLLRGRGSGPFAAHEVVGADGGAHGEDDNSNSGMEIDGAPGATRLPLSP